MQCNIAYDLAIDGELELGNAIGTMSVARSQVLRMVPRRSMIPIPKEEDVKTPQPPSSLQAQSRQATTTHHLIFTMHLLNLTLLALAGPAVADWFVQEYSGTQCNGQRVGEIWAFPGSARQCLQLESEGLTGSVLISLQADDTPYTFVLHEVPGCLDNSFPGGINCEY